MSKKGQTAILDDMGDSKFHLTTHAYDYYAGFRTPEHFHNEDQLLYGVHGVMTVRTPHGIWVVPPQRAIWIPAKIPHSTEMSGIVGMRTLWFRPKVVQHLPRRCHVMNVSPLLRELILHACDVGKLNRRSEKQKLLLDFIINQLQDAKQLPLQLPMPNDPRAMKVAEMLIKDPSSSKSLNDYERMAGASKRTLARLFESETQMTFGKWRQQLRLLHAMKLLASGSKIIEVALDTGYSSPSAFVSMFKSVLGKTPNKYFE